MNERILDKESDVEIRLFNHATGKVAYATLTERQLQIISMLMAKDEHVENKEDRT